MDKDFTLFWRTGDREVVRGADIADAMNRAGYGAGALPALDFHAKGDNQGYEWDSATNQWESLEIRALLAQEGQGNE